MAALPTSSGNLQLRRGHGTIRAAGRRHGDGPSSPSSHPARSCPRQGQGRVRAVHGALPSVAVGCSPGQRLPVLLILPGRWPCPPPWGTSAHAFFFACSSPGRRCCFNLSEGSGRSKAFSDGSHRAAPSPDCINVPGPTVSSSLGRDVPVLFAFIHPSATDPGGAASGLPSWGPPVGAPVVWVPPG